MIEAYVDESLTHTGQSLMCVAGYLYEKEKSIELDEKLRELYELYQIPFFHAAQCEAGEPPFDKLDRPLRDNLRRKIIEYIHQYATYGLAVTVSTQLYTEKIGATSISPYTLCLWCCLGGVSSWARRTAYDGQVAYLFEDGASHQGEAERVMNRIYQEPGLKEAHHLASRTFASKKLYRPLHTADLFAWGWARYNARKIIGQQPESYLRELTTMPCEVVKLSKSMLAVLAPKLSAVFGSSAK